jgi:NTP pyrophosphatase (non-canonical NTP hydrolase)
MTTFTKLREANRARQAQWDADDRIGLIYRANELAGEVGEACNVAKKIERERLGIAGSRASVAQLAEELADVVICADLVAMGEGIDLDAAVAAKFNATSQKIGLPQRLSARGYQARVDDWMQACFGAQISADLTERCYRFLEEAGELCQALGMTQDQARQMIDYTFSREAGEPRQELGGVMVTLAALCNAAGLDMSGEGEAELTRIDDEATRAAIRAKQANKPLRGQAV